MRVFVPIKRGVVRQWISDVYGVNPVKTVTY